MALSYSKSEGDDSRRELSPFLVNIGQGQSYESNSAEILQQAFSQQSKPGTVIPLGGLSAYPHNIAYPYSSSPYSSPVEVKPKSNADPEVDKAVDDIIRRLKNEAQSQSQLNNNSKGMSPEV